MERNVVIIAADKPVACINCRSGARIRMPVYMEDFPAAVRCPNCKAITVWDGPPMLPKCDPSTIGDGVYWRVIPRLTEEQSENPGPLFEPHLSDAGKIEPVDGNQPEQYIPFSVATNNLGESVKGMFEQARRIVKDIKAFEFQIGNYFLMVWRGALRFKNYWREEYLHDFLEWPMLSFPVECTDVHNKRNARWVMAPRFFAPKYGIQVPMAGGFSLQLCNQFTRLSFPLEIEDATALQVPEPLHLSVVGNKIIGPSLPLSLKQIPGIDDDIDATVQNQSVYITRNEAARPWLANNGVQPWAKVPIDPSIINYPRLPEVLAERKECARGWETLRTCGRIGLFHHDLSVARETAMYLAAMIRGPKCFFVNGIEDAFFYKKIRTTLQGVFNDPTISASSYIYMSNGEPVNIDLLQRTSVCIVDMNHDGIDDEMFTKLFDYRGVVIVVSTDPLFDYTEDNLQCPRVYGLAGFPQFDTELFPVETANSLYKISKDKENSYIALVKSMKDQVKGDVYESVSRLFRLGN